MIKKFLISCLLGANVCASELPLNSKFIQAEIKVESNFNDKAIGDNGKAIGCLQIHRGCFQDSIRFNPSLKNANYNNCFNRDFSCKIMMAYLNRYESKAIAANDYETLSKCWNGGCNWRKHPYASDSYWIKIKINMK